MIRILKSSKYWCIYSIYHCILKQLQNFFVYNVWSSFIFTVFRKQYFYVSICKVISCGSGVPIDDHIYLVMPDPSQFPDVANVQWENAIYSWPCEKLQTPDPNPCLTDWPCDLFIVIGPSHVDSRSEWTPRKSPRRLFQSPYKNLDFGPKGPG